MPKVDLYGTQQPIALLLFLVSKQALYDRGKDLNLKHVRDLDWVAAMGPPGGGRNPTDPRFISMFNLVHLAQPSKATLEVIFGSILSGRMDLFPESAKGAISSITDVTLRLFENIQE